MVKTPASEVGSAQISKERKVRILDLHIKGPIKNQYLKISSLHLDSGEKNSEDSESEPSAIQRQQ